MAPDYSKGQIYVIRNMVNDFVYVGSTTETISRRWSKHMEGVRDKRRKHYKIYQAMEELGVDNFYIEFVEAWPCENKGQLCAREGHYIRQFDSVKNGYNNNVAGRTEKQRYEEDNEAREKRLKRLKERYCSDEKYREAAKKKTRDHYRSDEKYREAVKERTREYRLRKKEERMQGPAETELLELK